MRLRVPRLDRRRLGEQEQVELGQNRSAHREQARHQEGTVSFVEARSHTLRFCIIQRKQEGLAALLAASTSTSATSPGTASGTRAAPSERPTTRTLALQMQKSRSQ